MVGADNRTLPEDVRRKRPFTKVFAIVLSAVVIIAALAGAVLLMGNGEGKATASLVADRTAAAVRENITFDASASSATGKIVNYQWNFGDGHLENTSSASNVHAYSVPGIYMVLLTVKDDKDHADTNWNSPLVITIIERTINPDGTTANASLPQAFMAVDGKLVNASTTVHFDASSSQAWSTELKGSAWAAQLSSRYIRTMALDFGDGSAVWSIDVAAILADNATTFDSVFSSSTNSTAHAYGGDGVTYVAKLTVRSIHDAVGEYWMTMGVLPKGQVSDQVVKNGDTFVVATVFDPQSLDPARVSETSSGEIVQNCYETLVWYNGSSVSELTPMLSTAVPTVENGGISSDGLTYSFTVRPNVKFHSGNVLKASDVEFSIERVLTINSPYGSAWMLGQVMVPSYNSSALDPELIADSIDSDDSTMTVTFHLVKSYPAFLYILAGLVGSVVEKAYVMEHTPGGDHYNTANTWMDRHVDGTGAFTLGQWVAQQHIQMDRFEGYWQGPANLAHVIIMNVVQPSTREMMLLSGDADNAYIDRQRSSSLRDREDLTITEGQVNLNLDFIMMNQDIKDGYSGGVGDIPSDFFANAHVRKAFVEAFNYTKYIQDVLLNTGFEPNGPIARNISGYDPTVPAFQYDLADAAHELSLAENPSQPGSSYLDTGFTIKLFYLVGNDIWKSGCLLLEQGLESISPHISVEVVGIGSSYYSYALRGQLSIFFLAWQPDYPDPDNYVNPLLYDQGTFSGATGIDNDTLDNMIREASTELDQSVRNMMYRNISLACQENAYYLWTKQSTQFHVDRSWVTGYYYNPMYSGMYYYPLDKG